MEEILAQVKTYDIPELRKKLIENGVDVGPIYKSSISLFQRRLAKKLFELQGGKLEEEDEGTKKPIDAPQLKQTPQSRPTESPFKQSDVFYAICLPESLDPTLKEEVGQLVFSDKELALKTAKKVKNSRFKIFTLEKDAHEFTKLTAESAFNSPRKPPAQTQDQKEKPAPSESSPYKSPRPQEVVVLRKAIESGNVEFFKKCIWDNPRYLVGSGDTPVMYQEGFRYTAMHVAALKNKPDACRVILDTLENPEFVQQLYSQSRQTEATRNGIINFLVDMYLNMGDKGNCESPLHMACKFGHDEVVEILISHPKTDRKLRNKHGESPKDIICSRCPSASAALKGRIEMLLEGQSYVPLLRSEDNSTTPVIGQPWSPDKNSSLQKEEKTWSPKDPSMSVKAYAGPMSPSNARSFHKRWTTPPSQSPDQAKKYFDMKRGDCEKGMERIGRQLAREMKIPWLEYWEFLNTYVDLSHDNGLELLEKYFEKMIWLEYVKAFKDKHGGNESVLDFSTPLKKEKPKSKEVHENVIGRQIREGVVSEKNNNLPEDSDDKSSEVISPMSSLAQKFARIKLMNESWSDRATVYITDTSTDDDKSDVSRDSNNHSVTNKRLTDPETVHNRVTVVNKLTGLDSDSTIGSSVDGAKESSVDPDEDNCVDNINRSTADKTKEGSVDDEKESNNGCVNVGGVDNENETSVAETKGKCEEDIKERNVNDIKKDSICDVKEGIADMKEKSHDASEDTTINGAMKSSKNALKGSSTVNTDGLKDQGADSPDCAETYNKTGLEIATNIGDTNKLKDDQSDKDNQADDEALPSRNKTDLLKQRSISSDSTDSFKTTAEEVDDVDKFHDLEETEHRVCINIGASSVDQLKEHLNKHKQKHEVDESSTNAHFVVRLKSDNSGMKVDIISIPDADIVTCNDLFVLEDIGVSACEGDIGGTEEGDIVEIGTGVGKTDQTIDEAPVTAYLSRSVTLPKVAYLHGPQPTREDLDVSRALGDMVIVPDLYPNVFRWKIRLSRFLKDTNYRWQSPAKVRTKLQQGSPRPSPLRQASPVIQYGSPLGLQTQSRLTATSDIRTRLFPSISE